MIIKSKDFDKGKDGYSVLEVDWYTHIPYDNVTGAVENHRLSLRKNMKTGKYEVYKHYFHKNTNEVVFESESLRDAVYKANEIMEKYWHRKYDDEVEENGR